MTKPDRAITPSITKIENSAKTTKSESNTPDKLIETQNKTKNPNISKTSKDRRRLFL